METRKRSHKQKKNFGLFSTGKEQTKPTREVRQNFWRHQVRSYLPGPKGVAARNRHVKNRAAAKRAKQARKKNR